MTIGTCEIIGTTVIENGEKLEFDTVAEALDYARLRKEEEAEAREEEAREDEEAEEAEALASMESERDRLADIVAGLDMETEDGRSKLEAIRAILGV